MIRGYPACASVAPGERLVLHVSTDAPRFRVAFHRWAGEFVRMQETGWLPGKYAEPKRPEEDWEWPDHAFSIPADWPSGVYVAHLQEPDAVPLALAMTEAAALFVVRSSSRGRERAKLLYKLPLATYHAYNWCGGGCFYVNPPRWHAPPGAKLSLHRPGGGIGGDTWGADDYYDSTSPRQTFAHWDARFIRWLYAQGYEPDFCIDFDLHRDSDLCRDYRLLLSVGHDEYWTEPTRDAVEDFVARGGNVAFFGANLCWWRIHLIDDGGAIVCHQGGPQGAFDHWWPATGVHRPEDSLTGLSYRHGGGWWDGPRETAGYIVQDARHWVYEGTGLADGAAFGKDSAPPLVGYECDGAPLASFDLRSGRAALSPEAHATGTPEGFNVLAASMLGEGWQERPPRETHAAHEGIHAAVMGVFSRNGTVFCAGTTDWAQVLGSGQDERVDIITRNVIARLSSS